MDKDEKIFSINDLVTVGLYDRDRLESLEALEAEMRDRLADKDRRLEEMRAQLTDALREAENDRDAAYSELFRMTERALAAENELDEYVEAVMKVTKGYAKRLGTSEGKLVKALRERDEARKKAVWAAPMRIFNAREVWAANAPRGLRLCDGVWNKTAIGPSDTFPTPEQAIEAGQAVAWWEVK